ncbi:MAG TPA: exodeoxyribonuclease VII small subunit [Elusimicrobia bacterium]|nr:MAG: exodeoxyribonuclease VII small subunit [Elusimicrobia bacterium RIFOXYA12_FULL_49_49]OGS10999.1 MAG: exodeoxyribonuclease VII small subunit [Elusimicrobia bacterium RIFOXYB1_FULL_48_9]OGS15165.1 MAG: exodeoxyribonuclease VII small subunit [Elusimicrobia bacterium RIFOXYA2_FULL_47_53]OGS29785.1 MAG: exodeoxyribonuclease VII small subunit [Elusimicrobia bacterium RIFOXYB2_FULL_46_23]HBU70268.1 exodeoxyribonuclease VII small subunit [Elusimicrobiota bacterium]
MAKTMKFEEALKRLEEIVTQMENSQSDLDKSLELFEEGVKLVRFCSGKLEESKKKIEILVKKGPSMAAEPFSVEDEDKNTGELFK